MISIFRLQYFLIVALALAAINVEASPKIGVAPKERGGVIEIKASRLLSTGKEAPLKKSVVTLLSFKVNNLGDIELEKSLGASKTDAAGNVSFKGLPRDRKTFYIAKVDFGGREFRTEILNFEGNDRIDARIVSYDETHSDENLRILKKHLIIESFSGEDKEKLSVSEVLIIENTSTKAYYPPEKGGLKIDVPKGIKNLRFKFGVSPENITYREGEDYFLLATPVYPGHSNMLSLGISYEIGFTGNRTLLEGINNYAVSSTVILNSNPDVLVEGENVKSHGEKSMGDKVYSQYQIDDIKKGESYSITIQKKGAKIKGGKLVVLFFIVLIIGFAVFASIKWRKR